MSTVIRPTNMAIAFVNAAIRPLKKHGNKAVWTARRVADNADREIGIIRDFNEINISRTSPYDVDKRLRGMGFNLGAY